MGGNMFENLHWIGHASFYIKSGGITLYIDPFNVSERVASGNKADLILVTHAHFDHFSKLDIEKVKQKNTLIITSTQTLREGKNVRIARPGFKYDFEGVSIEAVPAYNIVKERLDFHPKANEWVGYVIHVDDGTIYHAGDTDFVPEMLQLKGIDLALLPMGGTYTMGVDEVVEAANAIDAKYVAPMHYKNLLGREGSQLAEERFKNKVGKALLLKEVQEPTYSFKQ
ncbi:MAG: MBL fold metallo-hydrolase [Candidatus Micrarchaeia archaeon]